MNRSTVVLLALGIVLAHTLAIHQTPGGVLAAPYEQAHVSFRLAHHLVHEGSAVWDPQQPGSAPPASPFWVGLAALGEYGRLYPTRVAQAIGILCTLLAAIVLTQFSPERLAGLIAPVLFATSGSTAAAAGSGTEAPLALLLLTTVFLAFERAWPRVLFVSLVCLVMTRPEGTPILLFLWLLYRLDPPQAGRASARAALRHGLVATTLAVLCLGLVRGFLAGVWLAPWERALLEPDLERWKLGLAYFGGFLEASATAPLLLLPLILTVFRRLGGTGRRSLYLFGAWSLLVVLPGGDGLPFWNALAPAVPLALLAIQTAITGWLDENPRHAPAAWSILVVTALSSLLVSMTPGDLGPIRLRRVLEAWMAPGETLARGYPRPLGRAGLIHEIRDVESLRSVGVFLRDKVEPDATIGTFWPGAIGYLSRKQVVDLRGRASSLPGAERASPWSGSPRVDVVRAIQTEPDYLVPSVGTSPTGSVIDLLRAWLQRFDVVGDEPERLDELMRSLADYEVVSVPVPRSSRTPERPSATPFVLLRHTKLGQTPKVRLQLEGERFHVEAESTGHRQIVDLTVRFDDEQGHVWSLSPTGAWALGRELDARTSLLLYDTGTRPIRLVTGTLPAGVESGRLTARLHSPGLSTTSPLATAGTPASVMLGPGH